MACRTSPPTKESAGAGAIGAADPNGITVNANANDTGQKCGNTPIPQQHAIQGFIMQNQQQRLHKFDRIIQRSGKGINVNGIHEGRKEVDNEFCQESKVEAYQQFGQQQAGMHIVNNSNAAARSIGVTGTIVLAHQEDRSQQQQYQQEQDTMQTQNLALQKPSQQQQHQHQHQHQRFPMEQIKDAFHQPLALVHLKTQDWSQDPASPTAPPVLPDLTLGASSPSSR
ncbi:hypothetical protein KI688_011931 [Linnemannia hyalina]|uniref:Uncharacterized protein n=1 Tax=Linnemannia hyalina TaxID=64524 RepID=A0A9P8BT21_9FUNG|nr:hypothetical protein KI688_011931 [Linnemannia hyalina]